MGESLQPPQPPRLVRLFYSGILHRAVCVAYAEVVVNVVIFVAESRLFFGRLSADTQSPGTADHQARCGVGGFLSVFTAIVFTPRRRLGHQLIWTKSSPYCGGAWRTHSKRSVGVLTTTSLNATNASPQTAAIHLLAVRSAFNCALKRLLKAVL